MLCYRCGSYNPEGSRKCSVCAEDFAKGHRSRRKKSARFSSRRAGPPLQEGEIFAERYLVERPIALGAAGWVLRCRDQDVDVDVALKLVARNLLQQEQEREHFLKVVKWVRKLRHQNIARIYGEGRVADQVYYTMPVLEGLNLRKIINLRLEKSRTFALSEVLPLLGQLSLALEHLDEHGAHGALRPHNVIVLPDVLKVTGVVHVRGLPRRVFAGYQDRQFSPEYIAAEVKSEDAEIAPAADVFSLAVLVCEMLTGNVYGRDVNRFEVAFEQLPPPLRSCLRRALHDKPDKRYQAPGEFFDAVADVAEELPEGLEDDTVPASFVPSQDEGLETEADNQGEQSDEHQESSTESTEEPAAETEDERDSGKHKEFKSKPEPSRPSIDTTPVVPLSTLRKHDVIASELARHRHKRWKRRRFQRRLRLVGVALGLAAIGAFAGWLSQQFVGDKPMVLVEEPQAPVAEVSPPEPATQEQNEAPPPEDPEEVPEPELEVPQPQDDADKIRRALLRARKESKANKAASAPPPPDPPNPTARAECPAGMVKISGGSFRYGSEANDPMRGFGERNIKAATVGAFCIDRYEYPNVAGKRPQGDVAWPLARKLCEKSGKRLCFEAEWERACKGPRNFRFPFGNAYSASVCNVAMDQGPRPIAASATYQRCRSGFGVADMAGNLAEWTGTPWGQGTGDKTVKGGASDQGAFMARCAARANEAPSSKRGNLGFRCCVSLKTP